MKQTINVSQFRDAFQNMNRKENFSYAGLGALFDYLEELEEGTGQEVELDVIALCCEYSEYESLEEFQKAYSNDYERIEDIEQETTVIRINDDSFIIQDF
jgi:hypothetical protein